MIIKPSRFSLVNWSRTGIGNEIKYTDIQLHTRVCPVGGARTLGIVVAVGPLDLQHRWRQEVTVRWLSGSRKGKEITEIANKLCNYDSYKEALKEYIEGLEENELKSGCVKP